MGNNSSKWDREAHYKAMTTRQLEDLRNWWRERISLNDFGRSREELAHIEMLIAERIGKKKKQ